MIQKRLILVMNFLLGQALVIEPMEKAVELQQDVPVELSELAVCKGHKSWVRSVSVISDNKIVSGSDDNTVQIWDMIGKKLATCKGHKKCIRSVCVTKDGRVVSGSDDNTVRIWDMAGKQLAVCSGHEDKIWSVCLASENRIVSGSSDNSVRIWDMAGTQRAIFRGHEGPIRSVCIASDNRVVSGSQDKTVRIWDMDGTQLVVCKGHGGWFSFGWVLSVCMTSDNKIVSGSSDNSMRIWDMEGTQLAVISGHEGRVTSVCVAFDNRIVSGSWDGTVRIWGMNGTQQAVCKGHLSRVSSVGVTSDNRIVSGSYDNTVRIWDMSILGINDVPTVSKEKSKQGQPDETSASDTMRSTYFAPTSVGFSEHPTFVGKIHGRIYQLWKKLSPREAELLRPLVSIVIPESSKKVKCILGRGQFGVTYAGSNPQTKEIYAIKEVYGREAVNESLREGKIVHSLGECHSIMPLIDYINFEPSETDEEPRLLQVMPLAFVHGIGFKELLHHVSNGQREKIVSDSFWQVIMGLEYVHSHGVLHLDIKADNILYMKDGTLRIADFGRAQQTGDDDQIADIFSFGDVRKLSPEALLLIRKRLAKNAEPEESIFGKGVDVWAVGLYIWELLEDTEHNLFSTRELPLEKRVESYTYDAFEELVEGINFLKGKYSSTLLNLLRHVLTVDPDMRANTSQVIKKLAGAAMSSDARKEAFEEMLKLASTARTLEREAGHHSSAAENLRKQDTLKQAGEGVYSYADPSHYVKKSELDQRYVPADFYVKKGGVKSSDNKG